jgi:hypothetical protein
VQVSSKAKDKRSRIYLPPIASCSSLPVDRRPTNGSKHFLSQERLDDSFRSFSIFRSRLFGPYLHVARLRRHLQLVCQVRVLALVVGGDLVDALLRGNKNARNVQLVMPNFRRERGNDIDVGTSGSRFGDIVAQQSGRTNLNSVPMTGSELKELTYSTFDKRPVN